MLSVFMHLDFRSVWMTLSLSNKLFLLSFLGVSAYTLWLSFRVMSALRAFKARDNAGISITTSLNSLRKRPGNLRQLHLLTLYVPAPRSQFRSSNLSAFCRRNVSAM